MYSTDVTYDRPTKLSVGILMLAVQVGRSQDFKISRLIHAQTIWSYAGGEREERQRDRERREGAFLDLRRLTRRVEINIIKLVL